MTRYQGQNLCPASRIAVVANDALGNYVVSTPLLQMLRSQLSPMALHFFSGERTAELYQNDPNIDKGFAIFGPLTREAAAVLLAVPAYDLVINLESTPWAKSAASLLSDNGSMVCGPCAGPGGRGELPFSEDLRGELWADRNWISSDLTDRYPFLDSGFIGEIFCRLAYLGGPIPPYRVPSEEPAGPVPDLLIATAASLPEKLWPAEKWIEVLRSLARRGLTVGLIGAAPATQRKYWQGETAEESILAHTELIDLRGKFSLPEVVGALASARAVLTLDNGILHLACAGRAKTVGLFRYGIHRLWAPPTDNLTVLTAGPDRAVSDIAVREVEEALEREV